MTVTFRHCFRLTAQPRDTLRPVRPDVGEFGGLYVDVGANVGFCALMMAARGARVLAVDPLEDNVALLRGSIAANGGLDGRLEVLQVGVSAEAAEASRARATATERVQRGQLDRGPPWRGPGPPGKLAGGRVRRRVRQGAYQ